MDNGTCSIHSWNDGAEEDEAEPRMGLVVDSKLEHTDPELPQPRIRGLRNRIVVTLNDNGYA